MFKDRIDAGSQLAEKLSAYKDQKNVIVLAIPRGGVEVGRVIADALNIPLDVIITRKIGMPEHEELAIGAVDRDGQVVMRDASLVDAQTLKSLIDKECAEIARREAVYRVGRDPLNVQEKIVILTDDGIATGMTMEAAILWAKRQRPQKLILAVPVIAHDTLRRLQPLVDDCVVLEIPDLFFAVGMFYNEFPQLSDKDVRRFLGIHT
ncbi:MAG: phosphoribosyltransferase [bacterium]|nr:phosphoribosyltransferase [bacterium]